MPVKNSFLTLLIIFTFLAIQISGAAQEKKKFDITNDDIMEFLPPLEALIDSAMTHNPLIRMKDLDIEIDKYKLQADRVDWVKNLGLQANGGYGTLNNLSTNTNAGGTNPTLLATTTNQLNYGVGAFVKLPLFDILSRKNQMRIDKISIEQAQNFSRAQRNDLRQSIIKQYNDLILKHRILKIKAKYAETSKITMQMGEKDFLNGIINVNQYSSILGSFTSTEAEVESAKMDFRTAYMIFEEIIGFKLHLMNN